MLFMTHYIGLRNRSQKISLSSYTGRVTATVILKQGLFGNSSHVIVEEGKIILGQWQGIFLCEFDGPRTRQVHVQWVGKQN